MTSGKGGEEGGLEWGGESFTNVNKTSTCNKIYFPKHEIYSVFSFNRTLH